MRSSVVRSPPGSSSSSTRWTRKSLAHACRHPRTRRVVVCVDRRCAVVRVPRRSSSRGNVCIDLRLGSRRIFRGHRRTGTFAFEVVECWDCVPWNGPASVRVSLRAVVRCCPRIDYGSGCVDKKGCVLLSDCEIHYVCLHEKERGVPLSDCEIGCVDFRDKGRCVPPSNFEIGCVFRSNRGSVRVAPRGTVQG